MLVTHAIPKLEKDGSVSKKDFTPTKLVESTEPMKDGKFLSDEEKEKLSKDELNTLPTGVKRTVEINPNFCEVKDGKPVYYDFIRGEKIATVPHNEQAKDEVHSNATEAQLAALTKENKEIKSLLTELIAKIDKPEKKGFFNL